MMATRPPTKTAMLVHREPADDRFYTTKEVADILKVSVWKVYRLIKSKRLGCVYLGERTRRIPGEAIDLLIRKELNQHILTW